MSSSGHQKAKWLVLGLCAAALIAALALLCVRVWIPGRQYSRAAALQEAGRHEEAIEAFERLRGYRDSAERIRESWYALGTERLEAEDWDGAAAAFEKAGNWRDAQDRISETHYRHAGVLVLSGRYEEAYALYAQILSYRDVADIIRSDGHLRSIAVRSRLNALRTVGGKVIFGTYPQREGGKDATPIEWQVLEYDAQQGRSLLISRYALDCRPYHQEDTAVTWEESSLRAWLNGDFLRQAFTEEESLAILETPVDNSAAQGYRPWKTDGGSDTLDRIFLLSFAESWKYFKADEARACSPTAYAAERGAYTGYGRCWWWLRSPGYEQNYAAFVYLFGSRTYYYVVSPSVGVRPVLWIDLNAPVLAE